MAFTVNIYYTGNHGNAQKFVQEMLSSGVVPMISISPVGIFIFLFERSFTSPVI